MLTLQDPKTYRLPQTVLPRQYDIELDARIPRDTFIGKVAIQIEIASPTNTIELHAHELLTIKSATLTTGDNTWQGSVEANAEAEMIAITFPSTLPTGEAMLTITYDGHLSPTMEGLYRAKDGSEQVLSTQCEETDARKIYPCWDEPAFKAHVAWKVITDPQNTVLANGPLVSTKDSADGKSKTWTFAPTKLMSTYLSAVLIGEIEGTPEEVVNGVPIRVWAMKGKAEMGRFAHDYTKRLLPWYENYFQAPYHYNKYDQAAVPAFAAGAMENAGLVLFVQSALIMNPKTASWSQEKVIAHVVAHEFAHMWFGDLVTMKWWDDLWLNESFAEWISYKAVNELSPEYNIWSDSLGGMAAAMSDDALESTHPIHNRVETPAQATELFDNITYQKGCAVMRMLENFLGEEDFRAGLRTYIEEFAESNASKEDLWRHLATASGLPVTEIMNSWINQPGFPLVTVSLEGNTLNLSQRRYYSSPNAKRQEQTWYVPVILKYEDASGVHQQRILLDKAEAAIPLTVQGELKWLNANADELGFYRQKLEGKVLQAALANVNRLSPVEQISLLGDQWALTRSGDQSITSALDVLSALMNSTDYRVLGDVAGALHTIERLLEQIDDQPTLARFRAWISSRLGGQLAEVGYEPKAGESQNDTQRRVALVDALAAVAQDPEATRQATLWADREAANPASVDPNLSGLYVAAAAQVGDKARFDRYVQIYQQRKESGASPQESNRYLYSLPYFRAPGTTSAIFDLMDNGTIPQEAIGRVLRQELYIEQTKRPAWDYIKSHWPTIQNLGDMWVGNLVAASGQLPYSLRDDIIAFFTANLNGVADKPYARALETLDQLNEFKSRVMGDLVAWLNR
jgi:puromycin-sensitive aminopeptidase